MVNRSKKDGRLWKSWAFRYLSPATGKRREMGLGSTKSVTADQARENARKANAWLNEIPPKDPITERMGAKKRNEKIVGATVDKVIEKYIELDLPSYPEDSQRYIRTQLMRISNGVGKYHPKDVTAEMLCDDDGVGMGKLYLTNFPTFKKLRSVAKVIFAKAKAARLCPSNPAEKGDLDVLLPRRPKKHKVQSHLGVQREDMATFIALIRGHQDGRTKKPGRMNSTYVCEALALSGVRVSEMTLSTWSEIDKDVLAYLAGKLLQVNEDSKRWTVPWQHLKIKGDETDRPIPITSSMMAILQEMWDRTDKHGPDDPIFRSPSPSRRHFYTHNAIGDVFERIGWPEIVHNHGFRTTLRGWGKNNVHGRPHLVEIQLHHVQRGTAKAYSAQDDDWEGRATMMQRYDDYCTKGIIP
jgi:integrase